MTYFRRFIIGVTEFVLVIGIIAGTFWGAKFGQLLGLVMSTNPLLAQQANRYVSFAGVEFREWEFYGLFGGGLLGFLTPAIAAATIFVLAEIQRNTRQTALSLTALRGEPSEPRF